VYSFCSQATDADVGDNALVVYVIDTESIWYALKFISKT